MRDLISSGKKRGQDSPPAADLLTLNDREAPLSVWLKRHSVAVFLVLVAVASLRIISTYQVFSHTYDEPAHLACGMEWLVKGTYRYEPQHPPLARVAAALGPRLDGASDYGGPEMIGEGLTILYGSGHYDRTLALARLGILPFFWIAALVVYLWAKRYFGEPCAAFAVLCFSLLPPVLAHAGFATTDMALTAMTGAAFLAALVWAERPGWGRSLVFGSTTALAILSKFSALAFIPVSLVATFLWFVAAERPRLSALTRQVGIYALPFCVVLLSTFLMVWAGYRFSVGPVTFSTVPLPFPELYAGVHDVLFHNHVGSLSYLLGTAGTSGWWYFFLVVLAVKTPLPFFALLLAGAFIPHNIVARRGVASAWSFSLAILLFCLCSKINLGVRHILPVYLGFSVVTGLGAVRLLELSRNQRAAGWLLGVLLLAFTADSACAHPDYLAYFNALAGDAPERILVDSDLDWGQDVKRLAARLRQVGAQQLSFTPWAPADPELQGLPPTRPADPLHPTPGWNAVSLTMLKKDRFGYTGKNSAIQLWADKIPPTERIGKGIWLWYFPPPKPQAQAPVTVPANPEAKDPQAR